MMTREDISNIFERRELAWNRHDAEALVADYTEDAVLMTPYVGRVIGRAAIERVYRSFFSAFPDLVYREESLVVENNQIALFFSIAGTQTGEFVGVSATGRHFECFVASIFTMRAGQICFERRVYDFTSLLVQIGVSRRGTV